MFVNQQKCLTYKITSEASTVIVPTNRGKRGILIIWTNIEGKTSNETFLVIFIHYEYPYKLCTRSFVKH